MTAIEELDDQSHLLFGDPADPTEDFGAAIYARTSSNSQRFGYSIEEQIRTCIQRCQVMNWEVRYIFSDEAKSGRNTERPEFQRLLRTAEQGVIDVVVFWKLDRFCRSVSDLVKIQDRLEQYGVGLQSATEYLDTTTAVGKFNFRNLANAAELESDLTSQRVKLGMYGLAREHKWPNNEPPIGYDLRDDRRLSVNPTEADVVRQIFRMYIREQSMPQVAFLLNKEDILTKDECRWTGQSVQKVLSNELYVGNYSVAGFSEYVPEYRIIDEKLFDEASDIRFRYKRGRMEQQRKLSKSERVLESYKDSFDN